MFAYATRNPPATPVDFKTGDQASIELGSWSEHPKLHEWMERLYAHRGGTNDNTVVLTLNADDLEMLEYEIRGRKLMPPTPGFFSWLLSGPEGASEYLSVYCKDLSFVERARKAVAKGEYVVYVGWWPEWDRRHYTPLRERYFRGFDKE